MRLPSERKLSERFGIGRGPIREALKRLEFYGILRTLPQRGTVVASLGVKSLEGLIANLLNIEEQDVRGLIGPMARKSSPGRRLLRLHIPVLLLVFSAVAPYL